MQHSICSSEGGRNALYESVVVLIVEDDHALAEFIRDLLAAEGYVAVIAATPCTAAAEAVTVGPDVVLLDWVMPECDGRMVAAALRADPRTAIIPIVLMSGYHRVIEAARAIGTPFTVSKPFHISALLAALTAALTPSPEGAAA